MREVRKFEDLLESETWPEGMLVLRRNMLQTTRFDVEIMMNAGNDNVILNSVLELYRRVCPDSAPIQEKKYIESNAFFDCDKAPHSHMDIPSSPTPQQACPAVTRKNSPDYPRSSQKTNSETKPGPPCEIRPESGNAGQPAVAEKLGSKTGTQGNSTAIGGAPTAVQSASRISQRLEVMKKKEISSTSGTQDRQDHLSELRIVHLQMKWQDFDKTVRSDKSELFDFILTDPPYGTPKSRSGAGTGYGNNIDDAEIRAVAQFSRRALRAGGWFLAFVSFRNFGTFYEELRRVGFSVPEHPFVVMKDTKGMQEHRGVENPQSGCEFAVFGKAPGSRSDDFQIDFRSPYHLLPSTQKRKFACVADVPVPKEKLKKPGTKSPVLTEEKNINLLVELMTTFCPEGGSVLDMYAGTATTAIAAMQTNRKCTAIEADSTIYRLAHERLVNVATHILVNKQVEGKKSKRVRCGKTGKHTPTLQTGVSVTLYAGGCQLEPDIERYGQTAVRSVSKSRSNMREETAKPNAESRMTDAKHLVQEEMELSTAKEDNRSLDAHRSPERNISSSGLSGGDNVVLLIGEKEVGTASIQFPVSGEGNFRRSIHNNTVTQYERGSQHLIAVFSFKSFPGMDHIAYPYTFQGPSPDDPPKTLKDISGFFLWDVHSMHKVSDNGK